MKQQIQDSMDRSEMGATCGSLPSGHTYHLTDRGAFHYDVLDAQGSRIGSAYRNPHGVMACPNKSQVSLIPCEDYPDAFATVIRLGSPD